MSDWLGWWTLRRWFVKAADDRTLKIASRSRTAAIFTRRPTPLPIEKIRLFLFSLRRCFFLSRAARDYSEACVQLRNVFRFFFYSPTLFFLLIMNENRNIVKRRKKTSLALDLNKARETLLLCSRSPITRTAPERGDLETDVTENFHLHDRQLGLMIVVNSQWISPSIHPSPRSTVW